MMTTFLRKQNIVINIAFFFILIGLIWSLPLLLENVFNIKNVVFCEKPSIKKVGILMMIIGGLLAAPILETLIFQQLLYSLFSKTSYLKNRKFLTCIVSGLFFGLIHIYSLHYIITTSLIGFVLMYAFYLYIDNLKKSFWFVATIHFCVNLAAILQQLFL